jgi:putative pyruvate formate lyase activating enzyme
MGGAVTREEFARICLDLQDRGAENINIVTGSHAVSALAEGLIHARALGLKMPVLWNSSGYDSLDALALLEDLVDGYLPDLKTLDAAVAGRFFNAPDYPEHAAQAVLRMIETRRLRFSGDSLASGVIVRHLVLPGYLASTKAVLQWFADRCRGKALLSLMMQYTPVGNTALTRTVSEREYEQVLQWLEDFGIEDGYYQELHPGDDWLPDFSRLNPFSSDLSVPVWRWKSGTIPL